MKVEIKFEVELPDVAHTEEQLEEYLRYEFRDNGVLGSGNPFDIRGKGCDPIFGTFEWEYTEVDDDIIYY